MLDSCSNVPYLGERLHHVGAAPRVRHRRDLRLLLQDQLRVARHAGAELRRQAQCLVEGIRVQRLRVVCTTIAILEQDGI
jgi:hypothetical protein